MLEVVIKVPKLVACDLISSSVHIPYVPNDIRQLRWHTGIYANILNCAMPFRYGHWICIDQSRLLEICLSAKKKNMRKPRCYTIIPPYKTPLNLYILLSLLRYCKCGVNVIVWIYRTPNRSWLCCGYNT